MVKARDDAERERLGKGEHGHENRRRTEEERDGRRPGEPERVDEGELVQPDADGCGSQHETHVTPPDAQAALAANRNAAEDERGKRVAGRPWQKGNANAGTDKA